MSFNSKPTQRGMEAVYEAIVSWFVETLGEDEAYVRENCFMRPNYQWGSSPYDAINSEGLLFEWVHHVCASSKVQAVAKKHNVFMEPYTSWSLGLYRDNWS